MSKFVWCDRALFVSPVYYGVCKTEKAFKKVLKHLKIPKADRPSFLKNDHSDATVHYFERDEKVAAVVCVGDTEGRSPHEIVGLLIHEAVHIWQEVKEYIGESNPSREFEAYAIQTIAQRLIEGYSE
jgi:hypothetical protein